MKELSPELVRALHALVSRSSTHAQQEIIPLFVPEADAIILTREQVAALLGDVIDLVLEAQTEQIIEWENKSS